MARDWPARGSKCGRSLRAGETLRIFLANIRETVTYCPSAPSGSSATGRTTS
jgi:hypothetical protein